MSKLAHGDYSDFGDIKVDVVFLFDLCYDDLEIHLPYMEQFKRDHGFPEDSEYAFATYGDKETRSDGKCFPISQNLHRQFQKTIDKMESAKNANCKNRKHNVQDGFSRWQLK
eukprot:Trichotokara_eunicae@DN4702_c0_g1_i1.p1